MTRVIALVPARDESASIAETVTALRSMTDGVIVVDDGSTDATAVLARNAGASVVEMPRAVGKGAALDRGLATIDGVGHRDLQGVWTWGRQEDGLIEPYVGKLAIGEDNSSSAGSFPIACQPTTLPDGGVTLGIDPAAKWMWYTSVPGGDAFHFTSLNNPRARAAIKKSFFLRNFDPSAALKSSPHGAMMICGKIALFRAEASTAIVSREKRLFR